MDDTYLPPGFKEKPVKSATVTLNADFVKAVTTESCMELGDDNHAGVRRLNATEVRMALISGKSVRGGEHVLNQSWMTRVARFVLRR